MGNHSSTYEYDKIFAGLPQEFNTRTMDILNYQYSENHLYRDFSNQLQKTPEKIRELNQISFLPVSFFKNSEVKSGEFIPEIIFESSSTTGTNPSRHFVKKIRLYRESFVKGFELFYGNIRNFCVLGLLPAYLERRGSSLVFMVNELINFSGHDDSGFYLYDFERLYDMLLKMEKHKQKTLLIGVSFALLDFAEKYAMKLNHTTIIETGGMKGRKEEITRMELHKILKRQLGVGHVHSEYGMTELLSQAYSSGDGIYKPVPWMKALVRDEDDPLSIHNSGEGLLNIIDLANRDSCSFIATDDIVRLYDDGSFEVMGRMDNSDIRGCSMLVV